MKTALVLGGGGFIGSHMVRQLKKERFWVRAVDIKFPEFSETCADDFIRGNLTDPLVCREAIDQKFDEIYQFAADMGGAGFVFTGENDADIMSNSALINLNILEASARKNSKKIFYSSSACMYPAYNQTDPSNPNCKEDSAYPANPDSEYGWEKLFSERLYLAFNKNYAFQNKIARYHNIFGPEGTWIGGREKAPAAICRKIAMCDDGQSIEIWGDGKQTRSFLFIDECIEGTLRLMRSDYSGPLNIGSSQMVSINQLVDKISIIAGKKILKKYIDGPIGVMGRNSDNELINNVLKWSPTSDLDIGLKVTYKWINEKILEKKAISGVSIN